ncbi:thioredoxin-like protein [Lentinula raphanica]|uniref:Thioredoxin-like protein n=1 Tax=Lentinula raphanica TaxID=153919 RepID=A0AA38UES8_9AGAR|nr:thioredoxin-like protein [Lentinula raphanica]KAJ3757404.1 thioredoxin-like protein [Lentinula raphanica]KAJ3768659.1 thioredoxin-like protein [Lentinula raphanica]KAJ3838636.1 thioredoxin-like protein [Lentinula raphanica]KAJ3972834.1 thioredoxin-like protein [Lentinula raphanica]
MSAYNRVVKLTVISDVICPNCNIGQHELIGAISYCQDTLHLPLTFEIEFLPFRLIPTRLLPDDNAPKVSKDEFFTSTVGKEPWANMQASIMKWAQEKNIPIAFKGLVSQSTRAHRLSRKAYQIGGQNKQLPFLCAVFRAYLEENKDVADLDVLSDLAEQTGVMSKKEALDFLHSDELLEEVNTMCEKVRSKVTGVPMTIIDGKWCVQGGQSSDVFIQIFKKLADTGVSAAPSPFAAPVVALTA